MTTHPEDRTLEYVPKAAAPNQYTEAGLLTSGWISIPQAPSILLVAQGDSEIRSIEGTGGLQTLYPFIDSVSAEADGVALGTFGAGETIDFEALTGAGVTSVLLTLGRIDPDFTNASWLVAMRAFDSVSDPLARSPAHVLVSFPVPEPSAGALLAVGLAALAARARRGRAPAATLLGAGRGSGPARRRSR
jgi:hypothetical protein